MTFAGKTAFITGGAIGFGRAFGRALGEQGASIAIADVDVVRAEHTAAEFDDKGIRAVVVPCDVSDPAQVEAAVAKTVQELDGVDILVNNAALHFKRYGQPFSKLTQKEIQALFDVNVIGTVNCSLAVRASMQARGGGVIVNIASCAGHKIETAYGVSKLAVRGLTAAFAKDFAEDGTRVNAISPGMMATENGLLEYAPEEFTRSINEQQLIKRQGTMADVVNALIFLASDASSFMTGETLLIDGGRDLYIS
jgi:NAD(P)-dependent dehydrogenase (short-subunit alcohol dehydrogenase family)